jgi:NAD-dependent SIR2 family protein deacetylase
VGSKKLLELFDRTEPEDWAILAGAGISAPSGMPIGTGLMQHIIDSFVPNRYARDQISVLLEPKNPSSSWLRFEGLNQLLQDLSLDRDLEILNVYTKGTPNLNHQVLAHLAVEGSLVFTTNFDCLIEIALCSLLQETNGLLYYSPPDRLPPGGIFPIHGALHRYDSDCARRAPGDVSPAVTLAGVGRTRNNAAWREMFKQAISSRKLLVIGYSGSDDFDIAYWLGERQGAKETLWVLHEAVGDCIPVPVSESDGGSERRHWPLLELWRRWTESAQPCKDLFNYVEGNTMTILASVAGCLLDSVPSTGEEQQQTSAVKEQIASFLEVWRDKRNPDLFKKNLFTGQTLCSLQRYKEGVKFLEAGTLASLAGGG